MTKPSGHFDLVDSENISVDINSEHPQDGINEVGSFLNGRLGELFARVDGSQERLRGLFVELTEQPEQEVKPEFLDTIEEFVETSKYALLTFESLQRKVGRLFSDGTNTANPELAFMQADLNETLREQLADRKTKHDSFVKLLGDVAETDEQLTALVGQCYRDLGVRSDDDFNELWSANSPKVFVTLPKTHLEFLKRFDAVLSSSIRDAKRSGLFDSDKHSTSPPTASTLPNKIKMKPPLTFRVRYKLSKFATSMGDAFKSGLDSARSRIGSAKFSIRKAGAIALAVGVGAAGIAFGAQALVSDHSEPEQDNSDLTADESSPEMTTETPASNQDEDLNPLTNKPFTETEIDFLVWVGDQLDSGKSETEIEQMLANVVETQNRFYGWVQAQLDSGKSETQIEQMFTNLVQSQVPVEIDSAISETNPAFEAENASFSKSKRVGGDSSRKAQISARSKAANRNSVIHKADLALQRDSNIPANRDQDAASLVSGLKLSTNPSGLEPLSLQIG